MPTNVLLVEYEPRYIDRVQQFLANERDIHLEIARDGTEAVAAVARNQPNLVLISAVLPRVATPVVIADLRRQPGMDRVPFVLMMSGFKGKEKVKEAERLGANDILEKPFTREDLQPFLDRVAQPSVRSISKQALSRVQAFAGPAPNETVAIRAPSFSKPGDSALTPPPPIVATGPQLTSEDIFGGMTDDEQAASVPATSAPAASAAVPARVPAVSAAAAGAPVVPPPVAAAAPVVPPSSSAAATAAARRRSDAEEMEKKLEETLSGIMPGALRKGTGKAAKRPIDEAEEADKLLTSTLSGTGLDVAGSAVKRDRRIVEEAPRSEPKPEPEPSVAKVAPAPSPPSVPVAPPPAAVTTTPMPAGTATAPVPAPPPAVSQAPVALPTVAVPAVVPAPPASTSPPASTPAPPRAAAPPAPPRLSPLPSGAVEPAPVRAVPPAPTAAAGERAASPLPVVTPSIAAAAVTEAKPMEISAAEGKRGAAREESREYGQYLLKEKIATGGMAEVWKARMRGVEGFQKDVAIKKILPHLSNDHDFITMFIDEAKLAAQLNHNNIIHIYDLGKISDSFYIAMEYVDGKDLKTILRECRTQDNPLPVDIGVFVASRVASALDYAHRKRDFEDRELGLVHRDVSPQNVLISYEGDIKLCDFGIAKAASKASHTQHGALKGKLQYMSPEQAWGKKIDKRSDIFSLGAVLYEMLTGQKVFTGDSEIGVLEQVREASFTPPEELNREIPEEVAGIVKKALAKSPDDRYQSAQEMGRDMESILYSFKPAPNSADLAIYMHRLFTEKLDSLPAPSPMSVPPIAEEPPRLVPVFTPPSRVEKVRVEPERGRAERKGRTEKIVEAPAAPAATKEVPALKAVEAPPPRPVHTPPPAPSFGVGLIPMREDTATGLLVPARKSRSGLIAGVVVAVLLVLGGVYVATRGAAPKPETVVSPADSGPQTSGASVPVVPVTEPTPSPAASSQPLVESAADRKARMEEEVQKRLEEERKRLAALKSPSPAVIATPSPLPVQEVAAAPVLERPEPSPSVAPPVESPKPVAASAPPPEPAVRPGDLVEPGEGVVEPKMVGFTKPMYPPLAKARNVSGTVILRVLVSETGKVLETKILRGVAQNVGINEAATSAVEKATFRPATKDGIPVKMWTTMSVPFIL